MLTPIDEALTHILSDVEPITAYEQCDISQLVGRVAADDVFSAMDVPPWSNSAMDGYAVNTKDIVLEQTYAVSQKVFAGQNPKLLESHSVARIFTGAPIPEGADAVIMQENAIVHDNGYVSFNQLPEIHEHVRPQGQDMQSGQLLFQQGHCFKAADIGVLASVGMASLVVQAKPRVVIFSSGDELVAPGTSLHTGQIYNSNSAMLCAMFTQFGCDVTVQHNVIDTLNATASALSAAAVSADLIVSTGGVSVGEADFVKQALQQVGKVALWKLAIKPGKPLVFGAVAGVPYFGLPGNPSSAFVTSLIAVLPYLDAMRRKRIATIKNCYASSDFDWPRSGTRQEYLRVSLYSDGDQLRVKRYGNQSSGVVHSTAWANALAIVPIGATFEKGAVLEVMPLPI